MQAYRHRFFKMMWYANPWETNVTLSPIVAASEGRVGLVAFCSFEYLTCFDWPRHQQICRLFHRTVGLAWRWFRNQRLVDWYVGNNRCSVCGWLTRREYIDLEQCYECLNVSVCGRCVYEVPLCGLRCLACDVVPGLASPQQVALVEFTDRLGDKLDETFFYGSYDHPLQYHRLHNPGLIASFAALKRHREAARRARRAWVALTR